MVALKTYNLFTHINLLQEIAPNARPDVDYI